MMRRISAKKSSLSVDKMERDWRKNLRYMDNISAFPEEWYLMKDTGRQLTTSRSNPNLNSHRSGAKSSQQLDDKEEKTDEENEKPTTKKDKETAKNETTTSSEEKKEKTSPRKKDNTKASENEKKYDDDFE